MSAIHFAAQPGGVEVWGGEAEIVVSFPAADSYGDLAQPQTVQVDLDSATARHLAALLMAAVPTEEQELEDTATAVPVLIERTGNAPLRFRGRLVAETAGERFADREQNRWWELQVYRTDRGRYVACREYCTRWQGESGRSDVGQLSTPAEVVAWFREHDPGADVRGYPPGDAYAERQARLQADLRQQYEQLVTELLKGDEFAEEV